MPRLGLGLGFGFGFARGSVNSCSNGVLPARCYVPRSSHADWLSSGAFDPLPEPYDFPPGHGCQLVQVNPFGHEVSDHGCADVVSDVARHPVGVDLSAHVQVLHHQLLAGRGVCMPQNVFGYRMTMAVAGR